MGWKSDAHPIKIALLALAYSIIEYNLAVWLNSQRVKQMYVQLNDVISLILSWTHKLTLN